MCLWQVTETHDALAAIRQFESLLENIITHTFFSQEKKAKGHLRYAKSDVLETDL